MNLFDSSALLCFLRGESGAAVVDEASGDEGRCSAVTWPETAQKVRARGADWPLARGVL